MPFNLHSLRRTLTVLAFTGVVVCVIPPDAAAGQSGQYALPPVGRYTCYSGGMSVLANGMGYNPMTIHIAGFTGYLHILDKSHYGGNESGPPKDTGTYVMNGNDVVPQSGPYKRNPAALHYVADGQYHRPTMFVQWLDDNGKPMGAGSMICTWDGTNSK
ncbi:MAG TPA: hypothetical protein VKX25_10620 [Bryobacteraceae bacterium]|nr:hypothetical protein [Bryobacteraceae bacterium]